jgi:two-component system response regulator ArlR
MRLLLIEDEVQLADSLAHILKKNNYTVDCSYDGESGLDNGLSGIYDLIILDIMLPKKNGFEVVRALRSEGVHTPVIMLTARGETSDKVKGLDLGADDYLAKPFSSEELLARLRALSRRKGEVIPDHELIFGDLVLNLSSFEMRTPHEKIRLSLKECELMRCLMNNSGKVVQKESLLVYVWGYESDVEYNNLEVYISFLRKKLGQIKSHVVITTVRNAGYKLEDAS